MFEGKDLISLLEAYSIQIRDKQICMMLSRLFSLPEFVDFNMFSGEHMLWKIHILDFFGK